MQKYFLAFGAAFMSFSVAFAQVDVLDGLEALLAEDDFEAELLLLEEDLELDPDLVDEDRLDLEDLEIELLDRLEEPELDR